MVKRVIVLAGFIALWWTVAGLGVLPRVLFPAPPDVFGAFPRLHARGILLPWVGVSLLRVGVGFAVAAALGVTIGIMLGANRWLREYVEPIIETTRPIPPIAWIPLVLAWFGPGLASQASIVGLAVFFPTLISTYTGVASVDRMAICTALTMGAKGWRVFRDVMLPGAMPGIVGGVRIGIGTGLMALVAAEMIGAQSGLGFLIITYYQVGNDLPAVMFGMALLSAIGVIVNRGFVRLERYLLRWMPDIGEVP
jgi:ABC-type nitrate/sulfonate/bicarbonate transport system permease component